ncbi:MAG: DUF4157 domain-containing protein [Aureispira sp.]
MFQEYEESQPRNAESINNNTEEKSSKPQDTVTFRAVDEGGTKQIENTTEQDTVTFRATGGGQTEQTGDNTSQNSITDIDTNIHVDTKAVDDISAIPDLNLDTNLDTKTGIPRFLKAQTEHMSGYYLNHVRVHYNITGNEILEGAHAYTDGTNIYLARGAEKYLAHELWHIVQQMQGKVGETMQFDTKEGVAGNDNQGLERDADVKGDKANKLATTGGIQQNKSLKKGKGAGIIQRKALSNTKLNVVGESHPESANRAELERQMVQEKVGGTFWEENEFKMTVGDGETDADPLTYRLIHTLQNIARLSKSVGGSKTGHQGTGRLAVLSWNILSNLVALAEKQWGELKGVAYPGDLNDEEVGVRDARFQARMDKLEHLKTGFAYLQQHKDTPKAELDKTEYETHLGYVSLFVTDMQQNTMSVAEVTKLRSEYMHKAAESKAGEIGIWKIGTDHVDDILALLQEKGTEPSYNLLTKNEFDALIEEFQKK